MNTHILPAKLALTTQMCRQLKRGCESSQPLKLFIPDRSLYKRILGRIHHAGRLIESDVLNAEVTEEVEQELSVVTECNRTVVGITLFNQNVTVEASHLGNCENTDTAEGTCRNIEDLALCDVCTELSLAVAL